jgi:hypothetical protein
VAHHGAERGASGNRRRFTGARRRAWGSPCDNRAAYRRRGPAHVQVTFLKARAAHAVRRRRVSRAAGPLQQRESRPTSRVSFDICATSKVRTRPPHDNRSPPLMSFTRRAACAHNLGGVWRTDAARRERLFGMAPHLHQRQAHEVEVPRQRSGETIRPAVGFRSKVRFMDELVEKARRSRRRAPGTPPAADTSTWLSGEMCLRMRSVSDRRARREKAPRAATSTAGVM